jgi:hypothetical protein
MATTTPNFGWSVPTSSDLVKNGATAIETLGDSIDASLLDLKGGTTNQVLAKNSNTDMDFKWVAASAGKVLQVVQGTTSTSTTIATTTYTDTTLTATITPSATSSKILVITMQNYCNFANTTAAYSAIKLVRGATDVYVSPSNFGLGGTYAAGATAVESRGTSSIVYLDSPSSVSALTYKTQARPENTASSQNVIFQQSANPSTIILMEIGA